MKRMILALLLFVCVHSRAQIPTQSLIAFYPFTGNANDLSGNGQHGLANSVSLTADRFGNPLSAYSFTASQGSYIDLPSANIAGLNNYSYSMWIKPASTQSVAGMIYSVGQGGVGYVQGLTIQPGNLLFAGSYNQGSTPIQSYIQTGPQSLNQWYHIVVTRDNTILKLFVNGVMQPTVSTALTNSGASYGSSPYYARLGRRTTASTYYSGLIDDVRIYSTILSQSDVTALLNENCYLTPPQTTYSTCTGGSASLSAVPSVSSTVSWYNSPTSTLAIGTGSSYTTPVFPGSGSYTFYIAVSSCTAYARVPVVVNAYPTPTVNIAGGSLCQGSSFTLSPAGAATYSYHNGGPVITPTVSAAFSVTGISAQGCVSTVQAVANITVLPSPSVSINSGSICAGGLFTFTPSGATTYTLPGNSTILSPLNTSTYAVTGANSNGCSSTAVSTVVVMPLPSVIASNSGPICNGGTVNLTATGAGSYSWSTGSTAQSQTLSPAVTTIYSLTAVGANTCTKTVMTTVVVHPRPAISVNSGSICSGNSFTMIPSGAATYSFSGGSPVVSPATNTSYSVYGMSSQGCLSTNTVVSNVTVNATPTITVSNGFVCAGQSFTLQPSGATNYTYSSGLPVVSPVSNTSYTITGSNGNGCSGTVVANVAVVGNPVVQISGASGICAGGTATLVASGATFYSWSNGSAATSIVVSPTATTTYSVTGANILGCLDTASLTVTVNSHPVIVVNSGSVCSGKSFTLSPSGAATYTFSGGSGIVSPSVNTTYSVTGTSAQGCVSSNTAVANISVVASPVITASGGSICAGQSFTLSPSGGLTYTYSGGSQVVNPAANTNYTITGANASGCTGTATVALLVQALPGVSVSGPASICSGASATLSAGGAFSYTWSTGANAATIIVSPAIQLTYSVTGSTANGCKKTATRTISIDALPVVSVNSGSVCAGKSFTMLPSGAATYSYSSGSNVVSPAVTTSYSVTGFSSKGCISANPAISTVAVHALPAISAPGGSICSGNTFTIVPSGAVSYTYSGGSAVVSPASTTHYTVAGSSAAGCTATAVAAVTVVSLPAVTISGPASVCAGSPAGLTASGAAGYSWNIGATTASINVSPTVNTTYTVLGNNTAGCSKTATALVVVYALPVVSVNSGSICPGKTFSMQPSGAQSYSFSSGSPLVSPSVTGTYSVTGVSAQGCVAQSPAISTVVVAPVPVLSVNSGVICSGSSFTISPAGAVSYTYSSGSAVVTPTVSSTYTVTGSAATGCTANAVAFVTVNPAPVVSIASKSICNGGTGTMTVSAPAGYSYTWMPGNFTTTVVSISPSVTTVYTLTALSGAGCSKQFIVNYIVAPKPIINLTGSSTSVCQGLSAGIFASGATNYTLFPGNLSYTASSMATTVIPLSTTIYTVSGTSGMGDGCSDTRTLSISVLALPVITAAASPGTVCAGSCATINATGAQTFSYQGGNSVVCPGTTSTYTVNGTGSNGCTGATPATVSVVVDHGPTVSFNSPTICIGETATITASGASTYSWINGPSSSSTTVSPVISGQYNFTLVGFNAAGCSKTVSPQLIVNDVPVISASSGSLCQGDTYTITVSGASTYSINAPSFAVSPSVTTAYSVTGTNSAGCTSTAPAIATVSVIPLPQVNVSGPQMLCLGSPGSYTATGAATYSWSAGGSGPVISLTPGATTLFQVTGTNANGCSATFPFSIAVNPLPTVSVADGAVCPGFSYTLSPAGANTYTYLPTGPIVTPVSTSNYSIIGMDQNGCLSPIAVATVSVVNNLSISISGNVPVCEGQSLVLTAGGASSYSWSNGGSGSTVTISPQTSGSYSVVGGSGTCSSTAVSNITVYPLPVIAAASGSVCSGTQFNLKPSGATTYTISGGTALVTPSVNTSYTIYGTGTNGCISEAVVANVEVVPQPIITAQGQRTLICSGEKIMLVAGGAVSYTWSEGSHTFSIVVSPSVGTSYTVSGTDNYGCKNSTFVIVAVNECLALTPASPNSTGFSIFPNPNEGTFFVRNGGSQVKLQITDLKGAVVFETYIESGTSVTLAPGLSKGLYFCNFQKEGGAVGVQKLIITR